VPELNDEISSTSRKFFIYIYTSYPSYSPYITQVTYYKVLDVLTVRGLLSMAAKSYFEESGTAHFIPIICSVDQFEPQCQVSV
jgi:hypothetical protein